MNGALAHATVAAAVTLVATAAASASAGAFLPGLFAGIAAGLVAGAVVFLLGKDPAALDDAPLQNALAANSQLRHDIRGALSPALLVADRLTGHAEPGVVKAGNTVVRAVQRATEILEANKAEDAVRLSPPAR